MNPQVPARPCRGLYGEREALTRAIASAGRTDHYVRATVEDLGDCALEVLERVVRVAHHAGGRSLSRAAGQLRFLGH